MTYRTTFIASLSVAALVLGASETFADPAAARGAGVAPSSRPAFPSFPRSHQHHHRAAVSILQAEACSMVCRLTRSTNRWQWLRR